MRGRGSVRGETPKLDSRGHCSVRHDNRSNRQSTAPFESNDRIWPKAACLLWSARHVKRTLGRASLKSWHRETRPRSASLCPPLWLRAKASLNRDRMNGIEDRIARAIVVVARQLLRPDGVGESEGPRLRLDISDIVVCVTDRRAGERAAAHVCPCAKSRIQFESPIRCCSSPASMLPSCT